MIQPVALAERIFALWAVVTRLVRLLESVPPEAFADALERERALAEAHGVLRQHQAFEQPPR